MSWPQLCDDSRLRTMSSNVMPSTALTRTSHLPLASIGFILARCCASRSSIRSRKPLRCTIPPTSSRSSACCSAWFQGRCTCAVGRRSLIDRLKRLDFKGQTWRALTLLGASGFFFAGLPYMPLGEAVAIAYSGDAARRRARAVHPEGTSHRALGRGHTDRLRSSSTALVVRPGGGDRTGYGPVLLLLSALCGALSIIQIKRIRATDDSRTTVLFFTIVGTVVTSGTLAFSRWKTPTLDALVLMALLGALATAGQILMTVAFRRADAGTLAPFNYTSIVWAALFAYVAWGEVIAPLSLAGIASSWVAQSPLHGDRELWKDPSPDHRLIRES